MKTTKKELIDFIEWLIKQPNSLLSKNTDLLVDDYLKSINSESVKKTCHDYRGSKGCRAYSNSQYNACKKCASFY